MNAKLGILFGPAAALALAASTATAQPAAEADAVELDPVTITAPAAPLDRSLHLLRLLVAQSAPCLGCDAVLSDRRPASARLLGYLLESEPPTPSQGELLLLDIKLQDSPDLEYLRP